MLDPTDPAPPRELLLEDNLDSESDDELRLKAAVATVLDHPVSVEVILSNAQDVVGGYLNSAGVRELAAALMADGEVADGHGPYLLKINGYRRIVQPLACVDCGHGFSPESSPHIDRCWACAERDDEESGR